MDTRDCEAAQRSQAHRRQETAGLGWAGAQGLLGTISLSNCPLVLAVMQEMVACAGRCSVPAGFIAGDFEAPPPSYAGRVGTWSDQVSREHLASRKQTSENTDYAILVSKPGVSGVPMALGEVPEGVRKMEETRGGHSQNGCPHIAATETVQHNQCHAFHAAFSLQSPKDTLLGRMVPQFTWDRSFIHKDMLQGHRTLITCVETVSKKGFSSVIRSAAR